MSRARARAVAPAIVVRETLFADMRQAQSSLIARREPVDRKTHSRYRKPLTELVSGADLKKKLSAVWWRSAARFRRLPSRSTIAFSGRIVILRQVPDPVLVIMPFGGRFVGSAGTRPSQGNSGRRKVIGMSGFDRC